MRCRMLFERTNLAKLGSQNDGFLQQTRITEVCWGVEVETAQPMKHELSMRKLVRCLMLLEPINLFGETGLLSALKLTNLTRRPGKSS